MVVAHRRPAVGVRIDESGLVHREENRVVAARIAIEVVDFVEARELRLEMFGCRVKGILRRYVDAHGQERMALEVGADEAPVPRPCVLGVGRRMDADEAAPGLDEALHRPLLLGVEDVAGGVDEGDHLEAFQQIVGEEGRVFGHRDADPLFGWEGRQHDLGVVDGEVAKTGGASEGEYVDEVIVATCDKDHRATHEDRKFLR